MNRSELTQAVLDALVSVVPEARPAEVDPRVPLRDQLDIDSMDFINFVVQLHEAVKVDVPEADYAQLLTLESCVDYLARRLEVPAAS